MESVCVCVCTVCARMCTECVCVCTVCAHALMLFGLTKIACALLVDAHSLPHEHPRHVLSIHNPQVLCDALLPRPSAVSSRTGQ